MLPSPAAERTKQEPRSLTFINPLRNPARSGNCARALSPESSATASAAPPNRHFETPHRAAPTMMRSRRGQLDVPRPMGQPRFHLRRPLPGRAGDDVSRDAESRAGLPG
jgi:hypothetical protein